jgi:uncharacterized membrane protein
MAWLVLGLVVFLGVHSVSIAAPRWRDGMVASIGDGGWKSAYSVASVVGFVLIVVGYAAARQNPVVLWTPPVAMRHVAFLLMVPVFPLLLAAYLPGRIKTAAKHPMLLAVKIWATAHLLANGNLADVLLFGAFLAWAVADRISLKKRPARPVPGAPPGAANDAIVVVAGLAAYVAFLMFGHRWLVGVPLLG